MYAILFIPNENVLNNKFLDALLDDVKKIMFSNNFEWINDFFFMGTKEINAVDCVLIIQALSKENNDFEKYFHDIKMFRIEENTSLMPAIIDTISEISMQF